MNKCLVNIKGELLEILQEEKEPQTGAYIVPLDGFYDILNIQKYDQAVWSFEQSKWVGVGEPNIPLIPEPPIDPKDILIAELSISLAETQSQGAQAIAELTEAISMLQIPTV